MSLVRVAYAENIALLAETALRFLEIVQLNHSAESGKEDTVALQDVSQYKVGTILIILVERAKPLGFSPPQSSYYRPFLGWFGPTTWTLIHLSSATVLVAGVGLGMIALHSMCLNYA